MKKKYFTPEMEDVMVEEPVVLAMGEGSVGNLDGCPTETCTEDSCPEDFE